jgi:hypothetical protein
MSYEEEDTCMSYEEEDTCMSFVSLSISLACMSYEEEDTCMAYEEEERFKRVLSPCVGDRRRHLRYSTSAARTSDAP